VQTSGVAGVGITDSFGKVLFSFAYGWKKNVGAGCQFPEIIDAVYLSNLNIVFWVAINAEAHQRKRIASFNFANMGKVGGTVVFPRSPFFLLYAAFELNGSHCSDGCAISLEQFVVDAYLGNPAFENGIFAPN
jgi:hypothetical protein